MYGSDENVSVAERLVSLLRRNALTVSAAESCTGGLIAATLTSVPGASAVFGYGFVTYANEAKRKLLLVKKSTLASFGAVSAQTAFEMASGCVLMSGSDYSVAVTGIAGPSGGSETKPVGLVYIAVGAKGRAATVCEYNFDGTRDEIRAQTVSEALKLLTERIEEDLSSATKGKAKRK